MSSNQQIKKNIELSGKLANYLAENPTFMDENSENTSYVAFSSRDDELNKLNTELLKSLLDEGRKVVKAEETKDKNNPWKFTQVAA